MSGAMAMMGTVWLATRRGTRPRSRMRTWMSTIASPQADPGAEEEPQRRLTEREEAAPSE